MALFQSAVLQKYLSGLNEDEINDAWETFAAHFHNPEIQQNIRTSKEEAYQEGFLDDLFVKVLGFTKSPAPNYNLVAEQKNLTDSKKADGALLDGGKVRGVIELKGTETTDLGKVEGQAFGYKNKQPDALYVVISNFEKLRFYIDNAVDFIEFNLFTLTKEEFNVLWLCLGYSNFAKGLPKTIKDASLTEEENVTKKLYKDYSDFKHDIFESVKAHNPEYDKLLLFKKTQKLLDRFLFIFFAEDRNLLPPNSIRKIIQQWQQLKELDEYRPLYERFIKYFGYLNEGRNIPGKEEIFAYNGGLFAEDEVLDNLTISDDLLYKHTLQLSTYDFVSEVDVNILGHIFEHSLNEIEEINAELKGEEVDTSKTRRKKDGVFYTPKYITKYIVENTVGTLCEEKKDELEIDDERFTEAKRRTRKGIADLKSYRDWLLNLTICDPACGSGAFLNQALDFLIAEHKYIDELQAKYHGEGLVLSDIENQILENNLFGVDINEESVEIAKLSLWLRTAQKGRKLTSLNNHIKCGNSLIDDPDVGGDKAFTWEEEFPDVFANGGFDVVIGNPPYVDLKSLDSEIVNYIFSKFSTSNNRVNLYSTFIEKAINLLNDVGKLSFIIPSSILNLSSYTELRKLIIKNTTIENIVRLPNESFGAAAGDVKVDTIILTFGSLSTHSNIEIIIYKGFDRINEITELNADEYFQEDQARWIDDNEYIFRINSNPVTEKIISKIEENSTILEEVSEFCLGLTPYDKYKGQTQDQIKNRVFHAPSKKDETFKKLLAGNDIRRYNVAWGGKEWISYGDWLGAPREQKFFTDKRILVKQIIDWSDKRIWAALTDDELYNTQNAFNIIPNSEFKTEYLLALINSKLISFYHKKKFLDEFKDRFQKILIKEAKQLPIKKIDIKSQKEYESKVNIITELSEQLRLLAQNTLEFIVASTDLNKTSRKLESWHELTFKQFLKELKKKKVKLTLEEEAEWMDYFNRQKAQADELKSQIAQTDSKIDEMVYELYGLGEEEIGIVENAGN